jgi:tetratricopeptide (TPR) repeat protein
MRTQLVNNKLRWKYVGVLHEYIECLEGSYTSGCIYGDYYTNSGKSGSRSNDKDKYKKDAVILEKAHAEALKINDPIYNRYAYYCANSYFDSGNFEDAIKWYKITLTQNNWSQEKFMSCLKIFYSYKNLNQIENGMYYLVQSNLYDKTRVDCIYELVFYYCVNNMNLVAYNYYKLIKNFYENEYLNTNFGPDKLFVEIPKHDFFLPYYMIIVSDRVKKHKTGIKMYKIIFTKKHNNLNPFYKILILFLFY